MRIEDKRPVDRTGKPRKVKGPEAADVTAAGPLETSARSIEDVATFLGIPETELTANVRSGLAQLLLEVDRLRQDLEARERRIAYLERLADEDPLTPILNRRAFVRELSRMMAYAERYGVTSSVLFFDVNGMKRINDTFGHAVGDDVLTSIANCLLKNVRSSDVVGRLGGDEFGVLLAQTDERTAANKASELSVAIQSGSAEMHNGALDVSVSYGVFTFDGKGEPSEVLDAADKKMYRQKQKSVRQPRDAG